MALIKCPECGKEISDKAESCPNCGCPASEILSKKNDRDTEVLINEFQKAIKESHLMNPNDRKKAQKEIRKYAREKEILVSIADAQTIMKAEYAGKDTRNLIKKQIERTKRGQELDERFFASISETIEKSKDKTARCPRCKSTSISYDTKKLSVGRGVVGGLVAGTPGMIMGGLSSKKGYAVCLNCGKRWKI